MAMNFSHGGMSSESVSGEAAMLPSLGDCSAELLHPLISLNTHMCAVPVIDTASFVGHRVLWITVLNKRNMEQEANLFRWRPALIPYIIVIISLCKQVQKLMDLHRIWWIALSIATSLGKASLKFSSSDLGTYFVIDLNMGKMLRIVWECKEWFDSSPINPHAHSMYFPGCCTWTKKINMPRWPHNVCGEIIKWLA